VWPACIPHAACAVSIGDSKVIGSRQTNWHVSPHIGEALENLSESRNPRDEMPSRNAPADREILRARRVPEILKLKSVIKIPIICADSSPRILLSHYFLNSTELSHREIPNANPRFEIPPGDSAFPPTNLA
jgi:hypothetical protein